MRLLNVHTLVLDEFPKSQMLGLPEVNIDNNGLQSLSQTTHPEGIPPYTILSHTWETAEILFQDIQSGLTPEASKKKGFSKLLGCCQQSKKDGYDWTWIDACCINKSSSAELSEAINSMCRWYEKAEVCYAFLADVDSNPGGPDVTQKRDFANSRWFTRGWTLQELIAPGELMFFDGSWNEIGTRSRLRHDIFAITGVPQDCLTGGTRDFSAYSVATRMSWATNRQTTRIEDEAYCLMGLFHVNLPLIYGEGRKAFFRLQKEILATTHDASLFAWQPERRVNGAAASNIHVAASVNATVPFFATMPSHFRCNSSLRWQERARTGRVEMFELDFVWGGARIRSCSALAFGYPEPLSYLSSLGVVEPLEIGALIPGILAPTPEERDRLYLIFIGTVFCGGRRRRLAVPVRDPQAGDFRRISMLVFTDSERTYATEKYMEVRTDLVYSPGALTNVLGARNWEVRILGTQRLGWEPWGLERCRCWVLGNGFVVRYSAPEGLPFGVEQRWEIRMGVAGMGKKGAGGREGQGRVRAQTEETKETKEREIYGVSITCSAGTHKELVITPHRYDFSQTRQRASKVATPYEKDTGYGNRNDYGEYNPRRGVPSLPPSPVLNGTADDDHHDNGHDNGDHSDSDGDNSSSSSDASFQTFLNKGGERNDKDPPGWWVSLQHLQASGISVHLPLCGDMEVAVVARQGQVVLRFESVRYFEGGGSAAAAVATQVGGGGSSGGNSMSRGGYGIGGSSSNTMKGKPLGWVGLPGSPDAVVVGDIGWTVDRGGMEYRMMGDEGGDDTGGSERFLFWGEEVEGLGSDGGWDSFGDSNGDSGSGSGEGEGEKQVDSEEREEAGRVAGSSEEEEGGRGKSQCRNKESRRASEVMRMMKTNKSQHDSGDDHDDDEDDSDTLEEDEVFEFGGLLPDGLVAWNVEEWDMPTSAGKAGNGGI